MKKQIVTSIFAGALTAACIAQPKTGDIYIGGCVGYTTKNDKQDNIKTTDYDFGPYVDYYFKENMAASLGVSMSGLINITTSQNFAGEDIELTDRTYLIQINPVYRLHSKFSEKVSCYGDAGFLFGFGNEINEEYNFINNEIETNNSKISKFGVGIRPGIWWNAKPNLALTFQYGNLSYSSIKYKPEDEDLDDYTISEGGLKLNGKTLSVGLRYNLF